MNLSSSGIDDKSYLLRPGTSTEWLFYPELRIHLISILFLNSDWENKCIQILIQVMNSYQQKNFQIICLTFFHLFLCNNLINHSKIRTILIISLFSIVQIWVLRAKDPGNQNVADPTDPDPISTGWCYQCIYLLEDNIDQ